MVKVIVIDNSFFRDELVELESFTEDAISVWAEDEMLDCVDISIRGNVAAIGHDDGSVVMVLA